MEQQQATKNVVETQRDGDEPATQMKPQALHMLETYFGIPPLDRLKGACCIPCYVTKM